MHQVRFAFFIALFAVPATADAGPCSEEIVRLEKVADQNKVEAFEGPSERQTVGAQLHHQPTPGSVAEAQTKAVDKVDALLKRAKSLDSEDKEADCMSQINEAKLLLNIE